MAANMAQMGGGGPIRHRQPGHSPAALIYNQLAGQQIPQGGWHAQMPINQRVTHVMNITTNTTLAANGDNSQALNSGLQFERDAFLNSADKAAYERKITGRIQELFQKRQADAQNMHNTLNAQAVQQQAQNQQMMLNQMRGIGQPPQPGFQNLQQAMQPGQMAQHGQPGMGMNGANGLPMGLNQQGMQLGGQMRPQMAMQGPFAGLTPQELHKYRQLAATRVAQIPDPQRTQARAAAQARLPPQLLQSLANENIDPLLYTSMQQIVAAAKSQAAVNQPGMGMPVHPQRPMNQAMPQYPNASNGDFPFSNVESIMNQQKAGLLAEREGQMVVPASSAGRNATPQPLGGLPGPGPGSAQGVVPQNIPQQFNQAGQQSKMMDERAAKTQAQIRAQAQAKMQMQGQPNNLSPQGVVSQGPAMNALNATVGQPPMGIGNQGNPQMGQGNGPFSPQILDPRFNQMGPRPFMGGPNTGNNNTRDQVLRTMFNSMSAEARQQISQLPPEKINEMVVRWAASKGIGLQGRSQPPQAGQMGPAGPAGVNSMAQLGRGMTNMGQQPNMGAPPNQQNQMALMQQQLMANRARQPGTPQGSINQQAIIDNMQVPQKVLDQVRVQAPQLGLPQEVKKWGHLKQFLNNKNLPQPFISGLLNLQSAQFQSILKTNPALASLQGPQPTLPQQPPPQPGAQGALQQQQPSQSIQNPAEANMGNPLIQVSPQELQTAKASGKFKDWPDDRIRQMLMRIKLQAIQKSGQLPPGLQPSALQATPQQTPATTVGPPQPPMNAMNGLSQQQSAMAAMNAAVQNRNNLKQQPANARPPTHTPTPIQQQKTGTKRPSTDEAVEVPAPSRTPIQRPSSQQPPQQPQQQLAQPPAPNAPPQIPQLNPQQLASMPPEQRMKYEAMMKAHKQQASLSNTPEMLRLKSIGQEEHQKASTEMLHEIPMTPDQLEDVKQKAKSMGAEMFKLSKILGRWYTFTHDDDRARMFFMMRLRLLKQFTDPDKLTVPKDTFTMSANELNQMKGLLESMAKDATNFLPAQMKRGPSQQNPTDATSMQQAPAQNNMPANIPQPAPLSAANLEKQTQILNKAHQRSRSQAGGQPPAAPTTAQPPFSFGAQSPSGQPTYAPGRPTVTQENLQLPARKKPKLGGPQANNSSNASPQLQKLSSPEMNKRPTSTEMKQAPAKPQFMCEDKTCEFSNIGFSTEEILRKHVEDEHVKPYEDPLKFATDSLAAYLGLDPDGKPKKTSSTGTNVQSPGTDAAKNSQAPAVAKANELLKKAATPKSTENTTPAMSAPPMGNNTFFGAENTIDPQDLFTLGGGIELGGGGAISDMSVYRSITPKDTPESSKDSLTSEPISDLSDGVAINVTLDMGFDTWDPFNGTPYFDAAKANADLGDSDNFGAGAMDLATWNDVTVDFDKPFVFDSSLYSLDTSS
ncbi:hypothetical protein F5Y16DRAFT_248852 [Xylariaceae sp. FL0255]|nr:hypothetical protein F5Y16DRAFT_248852 [Xylariaceae sp. FL0255]